MESSCSEDDFVVLPLLVASLVCLQCLVLSSKNLLYYFLFIIFFKSNIIALLITPYYFGNILHYSLYITLHYFSITPQKLVIVSFLLKIQTLQMHLCVKRIRLHLCWGQFPRASRCCTVVVRVSRGLRLYFWRWKELQYLLDTIYIWHFYFYCLFYRLAWKSGHISSHKKSFSWF